MKRKKVLSIVLVLCLCLQLFCISAFAAKTELVKADFADGAWSAETTKNNYGSLVGGVYGKQAADYAAASPTGLAAVSDRFFQALPKTSAEIPLGGKLKISFDIAANEFPGTGNSNYARYVSMKLNGSTPKFMFQSNNVSFDNMFAKNKLIANSWNNVTAVFEFNDTNTASHYLLYINGEKALEVAALDPLKGTAWTSVKDIRIGGYVGADDKVYYDNFVFETYDRGDDMPALAFATASGAKSGYEGLVDADNKQINLENPEMTVGDFKAQTDNFVVLDNDGNPADDSGYLASAKVYAVYKDGINMYYAPYEVSVQPPVINANKKGKYSAIINNDEHTIRLVDYPEMTAKEFAENTTGATIAKKDGGDISDDTLLTECRVSAVLGSIYDIEYTYILQRSYAVENEGFDSCSERTSTGKLFENSGLTWTGHVQGCDNVAFKPEGGIGGKAADDKSAVLSVNGTTKAGNPMMYVEGNPYFGGKNTDLLNTFTVEGKLYISQMNEKASSVQITAYGRKVLLFEQNGTVKSIDNSVTVGTWEMNKWIPVAFTYFKDSNEMYVYVNGVKVDKSWVAGIPFQSEIRFSVNCAAEAVCELAIDDFKLYSDSLEVCKYNIADNTVTLTATESLNCVPILAKYDKETDMLLSVEAAAASRTVTMDYIEGETVKAMLWESLAGCKPIMPLKVLVDRGNPVNAYSAKISKAFGDGMVLQKDMPVKVWGTSGDADGAALSVSLDGNTEIAYVNGGKWEATLPAMAESTEGKTLVVATASGEQRINDILIGDVYYIGGQSNAFFRMSGTDTFEADRASFAESDNIRFFHQEGTYSAKVCADPVSGSKWESAASATVGKLSAIGAYFAKTLRNSGVETPIGLVQFAHNGTSLHYDIPSSITSKYVIDYLPERTNQSYNAMLAPVEKFAARGLIWYQGENDSIESIINKSLANYPDMFKEFIAYLKKTTGNDKLAVFNVQLSSHSISDKNPAGTEANATLGWNIPRFRAFQYDLSAEMGNVYIVPSLDCGFRNGDSDAAHPMYKKPVGERLANAALYAIYGKKDTVLAPMVKNVSYSANTAEITFENAGGGLRTADGGKLCGFEVIDENGAAHAADAVISGNDKVIVSSGEVQNVRGVRYAFYQSAPRTIANLENSSSVPCLTFANDINSGNGSKAAAAAAISRGEMLNK